MRQWWHTIWKHYRQEILFGLFVALFALGVTAYMFGRTTVLLLLPLACVLLTTACLYVWEATVSQKVWLTATVLVAGFVVAAIGTHTGLLFGDYTYGSLFGMRLLDVPLMIGVLWLLVTLSAWHIVHYGSIVAWRRYALAGVLVLMFDLVLEQFAIVYGLWSWQGNTPPLYNYVCWVLLSYVCFWLYGRFSPRTPSLLIALSLPLLAVFFWIMLVLA